MDSGQGAEKLTFPEGDLSCKKRQVFYLRYAAEDDGFYLPILA